MATVNHSQQSSTKRDPTVAPKPDTARRDAAAGRHEQASPRRGESPQAVRSATNQPPYRVVLQLADVSAVSPADELVHITPLMVDSAMESVGSGKASLEEETGSGTLEADTSSSATRTFANLLAASPSLQRSKSDSAPRPAAPQVTKQTISPAPAKATLDTTADTEAPAQQQPTDRPVVRQRIDQPAIKPVRRRFKFARPAWMPEIPPTLVLGLLICFTALLIGMLWRGSNPDSSSNTAPMAHDRHVPKAGRTDGKSPASSKVAAVPGAPKAADKTGQSKPKEHKTAAKPSAKKVSQSKAKAGKPESVKVPQSHPVESSVAADEIPAPRITGIRALPPITTYSQAPYVGPPSGQPAPQIVENPHVNDQGPVYEARRPTAQFQGNITPSDATAPHERY